MSNVSALMPSLVCRPLPLADIVKIGSNVAAGLSFIHSQGYVHGDLKDNNIGVSNVGSESLIAKLLDFGMMKPIGCRCKQPYLP